MVAVAIGAFHDPLATVESAIAIGSSLFEDFCRGQNGVEFCYFDSRKRTRHFTFDYAGLIATLAGQLVGNQFSLFAGAFYANDHRMMKSGQPSKAQCRRSCRGGSPRSLVQRRLASRIPILGVPVVFDFTDRREALGIAFKIADLCRLAEGTGKIALACLRRFDRHIIARQCDAAAINCWSRVMAGTAACQDECKNDRSCSHASISMDEKSLFKCLLREREKERGERPQPVVSGHSVQSVKSGCWCCESLDPGFRRGPQYHRGTFIRLG